MITKRKISKTASIIMRRGLTVFLSVLMVLTTVTIAFAEENKVSVWDGVTYEQGERDENRLTIRIKDAKHLKWLSMVVNGGQTLEGYKVYLDTDINLNNHDWTPIGKTLTTAFKGTFIGNKHTISNLKISVEINSANIINAPFHCVGLFGLCSNAIIKNLNLVNVNVSIRNESGYKNDYSSVNGANVYAGSLCGYAQATKVDSVYASNIAVTSYTGPEAGAAFAGGLFGYSENNYLISNCGVESGNVSGTSNSASLDAYAGGIAAATFEAGFIKQCYNKSTISGGHSMVAAHTGGIVGKSKSDAATLSTIMDCYNQGRITHTGSWLESGNMGGIIGYSSSAVTRCYNSGSLVASTNTVGGSVFAGGIAGNGISSSTVSNCAVISDSISGATKKYAIAGSGVKTNNISVSYISGSPVNDSNYSYDKNEFYGNNFYSSDLGWDFTETWLSISGDFPQLLRKSEDDNRDFELVSKAISALRIIYAEDDNYKRVTQDVGLTTAVEVTENAQEKFLLRVTWKSCNSSIIDSTGTVNRPKVDSMVKLIATIEEGSAKLTKTFVLNVSGTNSNSSQTNSPWAMKIDDAIDLVATMRASKITDIASDDLDVLVLTGKDTDRENVVGVIVKVMQFMGTPEESSYLRRKIGNVLDLLKTGNDEVLEDFVGSFRDDAFDAELDEETLATSKILSLANATYEFKYDVSNSFEESKMFVVSAGESINPTDYVIEQMLEKGETLGDFYDAALKASGGDGHLGTIFSGVEKSYQFWQLYKSFNIQKRNAVRSYMKMYLESRKNVDSPDDEFLNITMGIHVATSIKTDLENINQISELIYMLYEQFYKVEDEYKIIIQCPVDVAIYNSSGMLVGRVVNNVVDRTLSNSVYIKLSGDNNDEKTIIIQDDDIYSIELIGNDTGTMNVTIESETIDHINSNMFKEIALSQGKHMLTTISSESLNENNIDNIYTLEDGVVTEECEEVDDISNKHAFNAIDLTFSLDGSVEVSSVGGKTSNGYFAIGEDLLSEASPNENYIFAGYYTDLTCLTAYEETAMPDDNVIVYAKYMEVSPEIRIINQPLSSTFKVGDDGCISVTAECSGSYTLTYQWYTYINGSLLKLDGETDSTLMVDTSNESVKTYYVELTAIGSGLTKVTTRSANAVVRVTPLRIISDGSDNNLTWTLFENGNLVIDIDGSPSSYSSGGSPWYSYADQITSVEFTGRITSITGYMFENLVNLKELTIPNTVNSVEEYALSGCASLEKLTLPFVGLSRTANRTYNAVLGYIFGRVESGTIQYFNLQDSSLHYFKYNIPASLSEIVVTDASLIPFGAFHNCTNLTSVTINNKVTVVDERAFSNNISLKSITLPNSVQSIGENAFESCNFLESITMPFVGSSRTANNNYDAVFGFIFGRTSNGTSQYCLSSSDSIYSYKYGIPTSLKEVTVTDADFIPFGAFHNCSSIERINLNEGIKFISEYSFADMTSIKEIEIPRSVERIDECALSGCTSIKKLTVPFVGSTRDAQNTYDAVLGHVFGRSSSDSATAQYCTLEGNSISYYYYDIPHSLKEVIVTDAKHIAFGAFCNCSLIEKVIINYSVTEIGGYSFYNCTGLTEMILPKSVTYIDMCAFRDCSSLGKIELYNNQCDFFTNSYTIPVNAVIYGYSNSPANNFANQFGRSFVPFSFKNTVNAITGSGTTFDEANKFVYGLTVGLSDFSNFISTEKTISLNFNAQRNFVGTGTVLEVKKDDTIIDEYTVVVFGDTNNDGWYDGMDSTIVSCIVNGMLTREQVGEAVWFAADCNHDGVIDTIDVQLLEQAGVLLSSVNQTMSSDELIETSAYQEYIQLIDQNPDTQGTEDSAPTEPTPEQPSQSIFSKMITYFFDIFKCILKLFK